MLLTRRVAHSLLVVLHLAEHAGEGSFSAHDLAEFYGWPHEGLAKILQRLTAAGLLLSHHGMKGGYTLAREPRNISIFDVIKASEVSRTSGFQGARWRQAESARGYHPLRTVNRIIEDMLRELTIGELEEQASKATGEERSSAERNTL